MRFLQVFIVCFLLPSGLLAGEVPLRIQLSDIRSPEGNIIVVVYTSHEDFREDIRHKTIVLPKEGMKQGRLKAEIKLPPGVYGISVLDDEDGNGEMKYSRLGLPREGYGFSNFFHTGMKRPSFSDFNFKLPGVAEPVLIRIRYL